MLPLFLLVTVVSLSCVEDKDYGEANNLRPDINRNVSVNTDGNVAEDEQVALDELINLPFKPVESVFRENEVSAASDSNRVPGPTDRRLTVVLRFSEEDTIKVMEKIKGEKAPFDAVVEPETWFPAELRAKGDAAGDQQLKGKGYGAKPFTKTPWLNGSIVRVDETDYFVLTLQTS